MVGENSAVFAKRLWDETPHMVKWDQDKFRTSVAPFGLDPESCALLEDVAHQALRVFPRLRVELQEYLRRLVHTAWKDGGLDVATLSKVRSADLYLAEGCRQGDAASLAAFDELFRREFETVLSRIRQTALDRDDFAQIAREKLFVRGTIGDYSGHGDLRNWLRVVLTRTLLDLGRKQREEPTPQAGIEVLRQAFAPYAPEVDPELDYMKAHTSEAFRAAFERAARSLSVEQRNLLRQHISQGLGIDKLARMFGIHRATAARKVVRAREELLSRTREELRTALRLAPSELDSVMRYVESQVHLSLDRVLGTQIEVG